MRLTSVEKMNAITRNQVVFGRAPKKAEEKDYKQALQRGFNELGIQNFTIGMHAPSIPAEQGGRDWGIGTPYGNKSLYDFFALHGFNSQQLGPNGKLDRGDRSPYVSSVVEKNPLLINPQMLTRPEFAGILSQNEINRIVPPTNNRAFTPQIRALHNTRATRCNREFMQIAFENYKKKLEQKDPQAIALQTKYDEFIEKSASWIEYYSVLNIIADDNKTDYYPNWKNPQDRTLIRDYKSGKPEAIARFKQIQNDNADKIALYKFTQFISAYQAEVDAEDKGDSFMCIGDIEVGASKLDELVYDDVFLEGYCLGAPDGGVENDPQFWGIKLLDPKKLFNEDGTLGVAGQFLKTKLQNGLAGAKSIRLDHVIGLINPWIYDASTVRYKTVDGKERVVMEPLVSERMQTNVEVDGNDATGQKKTYIRSEVDPDGNFEKVIERIILPTLEEAGISVDDVVWEDIGYDETGKFKEVFEGELQLSGLATTKWMRGDELGDKTVLVSCHDDDTTRGFIDGNVLDEIQALEADRKNNNYRELDGVEKAWDPEYLAGRMYPGTDALALAKREGYRKTITTDARELWNAKLVDVFSQGPKNIQLSFMDLFGIEKRYNEPGTNGPKNWTLRLAPNYRENYYESLQKEDSWAINIPEIVAKSLEAKATREDNLEEKQEVISELNKWAQVLKEQE